MEPPLPPDPYTALGVPKDADASTIKSTYKKLALKYHPDKVADESKKAEATEKFHKIQRAYDIIGDDDERARYDAQVRLAQLAQLRRQNLDLRGAGPRGDVRTAGYDIRTAAPPFAAAAFPTHVPPRVYTEERRPSFFDEDEPQRASSRKHDYSFSFYTSYARRSAPREKEEKRERVRVSDEERKRAERERRREADVRESRSRKYATHVVDEEYARLEAERRQRDKEEETRKKEETPRRGSFREDMYEDERKYADAQRYMQSRTEDVRPATYRTSSTREPPYAHARRTTAPPEKSRRSPPRASPSTAQNQNAASKDGKENLHPPLRSHTTQTDFDSRKQAENDPPPVSIPRARTMPTVPTSSTVKKTESKHSQPSRGRTTESPVQLDSAYASAPPQDGQYPYKQYSPPPPPQAQPSKSYAYSKQTSSENTPPKTEPGNKYASSAGYRVEVREPRVPSPQREREGKPSATAAKMANLVGGNSRAHASPTSRPLPYSPYADSPSGRPPMVQRSSSRSTPRASRSPELVREREILYERDRSRDRDRREKFYGEMGPGNIRSTQANSHSFVEEGFKYSRRPRPEEVIYSSRGRRGSRDGPFYDDQRLPPQLGRSATMPVCAGG